MERIARRPRPTEGRRGRLAQNLRFISRFVSKKSNKKACFSEKKQAKIKARIKARIKTLRRSAKIG
jgi:hypothetical protein